MHFFWRKDLSISEALAMHATQDRVGNVDRYFPRVHITKDIVQTTQICPRLLLSRPHPIEQLVLLINKIL